MSKTYSGNDTLKKVLALIKNELSGKVNYKDQLTEDDVRRIWNDITGEQLPNTGVLFHNHDDLYSKLDHTHDEKYYTKEDVLKILEDSINLISSTETYGFRINQNESDPSSMISYISDSNNYRPARMNFDTGVFNYGDWNKAFFIKDIKVVMMNYDGSIAYEINKNDYTKKIDGTPSDISNESYPGNVMVGIPKVYWKIINNGDNTADVYISNRKVDDDFHCWSHIDNDGNELDYCYMAAYNGSLIDGKLRSISGKEPMRFTTRNQEVEYALNNNQTADKLWYTGLYSDRILIQLLLMLMSKSTNSRDVFGGGNNRTYVDPTNHGIMNSGSMNNKGLFWGSNDNTSGVKVFGIEHFWGNIWNSIAGWIMDKGVQKIKMTYGQSDGTTTDGYNFDGNGYKVIPNSLPEGGNGGFLNKVIFTENGFIPKSAAGSDTTYFNVGFWFNNDIVSYALVGGVSNHASRVGSCYADLDSAVSFAYWNVGSSLSFKGKAS